MAVVGLGFLAGACMTVSRDGRAATDLLARGDALAERGNYAAAVTVYDQVVDRYGDTPAASHARVLREASSTIVKLRGLLEARDSEVDVLRQDLEAQKADLAAREAELARAQREVAGRDSELARLRAEVGAREAEIAARQTEITRLTTESDQLRADLDQLKRIDLRLEQRRR